MSIVPRAPYGSLLKGNPLGNKPATAPKAGPSPVAKAKPKKGKQGGRK